MKTLKEYLLNEYKEDGMFAFPKSGKFSLSVYSYNDKEAGLFTGTIVKVDGKHIEVKDAEYSHKGDKTIKIGNADIYNGSFLDVQSKDDNGQSIRLFSEPTTDGSPNK